MLKFTHHGGRKTIAKNYQLGLYYWFLGETNQQSPAPPEGGVLSVTANPVKVPSEGRPFIDVVVASIERSCGTAPEINDSDDETNCKRIYEWLEQNELLQSE